MKLVMNVCVIISFIVFIYSEFHYEVINFY